MGTAMEWNLSQQLHVLLSNTFRAHVRELSEECVEFLDRVRSVNRRRAFETLKPGPSARSDLENLALSKVFTYCSIDGMRLTLAPHTTDEELWNAAEELRLKGAGTVDAEASRTIGPPPQKVDAGKLAACAMNKDLCDHLAEATKDYPDRLEKLWLFVKLRLYYSTGRHAAPGPSGVSSVHDTMDARAAAFLLEDLQRDWPLRVAHDAIGKVPDPVQAIRGLLSTTLEGTFTSVTGASHTPGSIELLGTLLKLFEAAGEEPRSEKTAALVNWYNKVIPVKYATVLLESAKSSRRGLRQHCTNEIAAALAAECKSGRLPSGTPEHGPRPNTSQAEQDSTFAVRLPSGTPEHGSGPRPHTSQAEQDSTFTELFQASVNAHRRMVQEAASTTSWQPMKTTNPHLVAKKSKATKDRAHNGNVPPKAPIWKSKATKDRAQNGNVPPKAPIWESYVTAQAEERLGLGLLNSKVASGTPEPTAQNTPKLASTPSWGSSPAATTPAWNLAMVPEQAAPLSKVAAPGLYVPVPGLVSPSDFVKEMLAQVISPTPGPSAIRASAEKARSLIQQPQHTRSARWYDFVTLDGTNLATGDAFVHDGCAYTVAGFSGDHLTATHSASRTMHVAKHVGRGFRPAQFTRLTNSAAFGAVRRTRWHKYQCGFTAALPTVPLALPPADALQAAGENLRGWQTPERRALCLRAAVGQHVNQRIAHINIRRDKGWFPVLAGAVDLAGLVAAWQALCTQLDITDAGLATVFIPEMVLKVARAVAPRHSADGWNAAPAPPEDQRRESLTGTPWGTLAIPPTWAKENYATQVESAGHKKVYVWIGERDTCLDRRKDAMLDEIGVALQTGGWAQDAVRYW